MKLRYDESEYDVGVVIGRFQVPSLHDGHAALINEVSKNHKKVLVLVGSTPGVLSTRRNPYDFMTRKFMIEEEFPDVVVLPLNDMPRDEDWSKAVDEKILEAFSDHHSIVLYGSRDAFIPYYSGKFPVIELEHSIDISGTKVRNAVSNEVRKCKEFRLGALYSAYNRHKTVFPTVDIALFKGSGDKRSLILGRKKNDPPEKWRFPGGFVDPKIDQSFEAAALRELREEVSHVSTGPVEYVGSTLIDDWRYRGEEDSIVTVIFKTEYQFGLIKAGDDLDEVKEFPLNVLDSSVFVKGHVPIYEMLNV